ncbi:E3 ubiquitin-protein ligase WAV3-like protein [Drosera capensis]
MGSKWMKAKAALGLNLCLYVPRRSVEEEEDPSPAFDVSMSDAGLLGRPVGWSGGLGTAAAAGSSGESASRRLSKSSTLPSQKTCSICLTTMKPGDGHAIFTAECSHSFHFHCIASNVKHGNQLCPVCRAKWKEIPLQSPKKSHEPGTARTTHAAGWPQNNAMMTVIRRLPPHPSPRHRHQVPQIQGTDPALFDDDEPLNPPKNTVINTSKSDDPSCYSNKTIDITTYPEVSSVPRAKSYEDFSVLVQLKGAVTSAPTTPSISHGQSPSMSQTSRTPVDLVTVLDISGSMAGTKLALLKQAMGFVIQNLSSNDRLSVVAFSSTARRLFPLGRMTESGRQQALQAVNSLVANGGTNIAEGLRKGAKVMEDRKEKNPVSSIILLSDGQDTYTVNGSGGNQAKPNYQLLLPSSIQPNEGSEFRIPVHTFGFGKDHDASSMHSISESSGGTFSFIETEAAIQDAFAQCIGGLVSVVVQQLQVGIECIHPALGLLSIKAGSYPCRVMADSRAGFIDVGDLYADEERNFLVSVNIPKELSGDLTRLLKVRCIFKDPFKKEMVTMEGDEVIITRSEKGEEGVVSLEVDRQRNRLRAADTVSQARAAAEHGDLVGAVSILENCRKMLSGTVSGKNQDRLCMALDAELKEMQDRLASRQVYESSGRAFILSGLSSHSWQRATARGDSTDSSSIIQAYQTPSMVEMLTRSQASLSRSPTTQRLVQPKWSFPSPKPRSYPNYNVSYKKAAQLDGDLNKQATLVHGPDFAGWHYISSILAGTMSHL